MDMRVPRVAFHFGTATTSFAAILLAVASSCSSEPTVKYGNPGNLSKEFLPGEAGIETLACGDAGAPAEGGACTVSWKTNLYPKMIGNDGWQCATANCHAPGKEPPAIDPANAETALAALKAYKMTASKQTLNYIDTSGDSTKSSIECNLSGACNPAMPMAPGKPLTADERCKLHIWLQCGAPNN